MPSLNVQFIPMVKDAIFEEPYHEKETWGLLTNVWEWSVQNAERCRYHNEVCSGKVDGTVITYTTIGETDPIFQRPVAFKVDHVNSPTYMAGPIALWEGQVIEARTVRMSMEELEALFFTQKHNLFLYRAYYQGSDPILYVRMHICDQ